MTPLPSSLYRARFLWSGLCIARQVRALAMPSRWGEFVTPTRPTTRGFGHVDARSRWLCAARLDNVTPNTGRPCVATVLGGVSRPSNVRASDLIKSQWVLLLRHPAHPCPDPTPLKKHGCGVPSLIVSSAPRPNLSVVWVVDRWVWMLLLVRNGHVSGEMVVCVGRLRASCIELSSRTTLQCPPLVVVEPKGRARCPECVDRHDSTTSVHRCSIVLSDAEYLVSVGSRPCSLVACAFCPSTRTMLSPRYGLSPCLGSVLRTMRDGRREGMLPVKKLVVGPRGGSAGPPHGEHRSARPYCRRCAPGLNWPGRSSGAVTLKKLECSKQAYACIH
ncbi:hypothetical protein V6N13_021756 [Hibiscus sabdariffa]